MTILDDIKAGIKDALDKLTGKERQAQADAEKQAEAKREADRKAERQTEENKIAKEVKKPDLKRVEHVVEDGRKPVDRLLERPIIRQPEPLKEKEQVATPLIHEPLPQKNPDIQDSPEVKWVRQLTPTGTTTTRVLSYPEKMQQKLDAMAPEKKAEQARQAEIEAEKRRQAQLERDDLDDR